jgi:hypothetical protein
MFEENATAGVRTEGAVDVASLEVVEYLPSDAGFERVTFEACVDFSGRTTYDGDGAVIEPVTPDRYLYDYVVVHNGPDTQWVIDDMNGRWEETC